MKVVGFSFLVLAVGVVGDSTIPIKAIFRRTRQAGYCKYESHGFARRSLAECAHLCLSNEETCDGFSRDESACRLYRYEPVTAYCSIDPIVIWENIK